MTPTQKSNLLDMLEDWWNEFDSDSEKWLEEMYSDWSEQIDLIGLNMPSLKACDISLNHQAITRKQFFDFFIDYNHENSI